MIRIFSNGSLPEEKGEMIDFSVMAFDYNFERRPNTNGFKTIKGTNCMAHHGSATAMFYGLNNAFNCTLLTEDYIMNKACVPMRFLNRTGAKRPHFLYDEPIKDNLYMRNVCVVESVGARRQPRPTVRHRQLPKQQRLNWCKEESKQRNR